MPQEKRPNVYLHPAANDALGKLQQALPGQGVAPQARRQDIASALVLYTGPEQAAGMLAAFYRDHLADAQ